MKLQELKRKKPNELMQMAEDAGIESASSMLKQEMVFALLKKAAEEGTEITGQGVIEVLQDGFGFLRYPEANYLAGSDDIYVPPAIVKKLGLRTGDTVEAVLRAPKGEERYFALSEVKLVNFEPVENLRHRLSFENLTPLYPEERLKMEFMDPTKKEDMTRRVIDLVAPQGKGQRTLIVAPPRTGKTVVLQNIAHGPALARTALNAMALRVSTRSLDPRKKIEAELAQTMGSDKLADFMARRNVTGAATPPKSGSSHSLKSQGTRRDPGPASDRSGRG